MALPDIPSPVPFEACPAASPGFSMRLHLIAKGLSGAELAEALDVAHNLMETVPGLDIKRYNPRVPMAGVHEG